MPGQIHISVARKMLDKGDPVSLVFLSKDGRIHHAESVVSLKYDFYSGTRTIKYLSSREIRRIRDVLILYINDIEIFI